jgi:S1-C subfamily serine protease
VSDPPVTTGVVSALDRRLDLDGESLHGLIQTDAPIEATWSGGPLVDASGAVIGITTDMGGERSGFCFATPIDLVRQMADELLAEGKVSHGWLGIEGVDVAEHESGAMGRRGGATVRKVMAGSPADRGGLAPDDVITELGSRPVSSSSGLVVAMRRHKPGDEVVIGYWRDGQHHEATVTVERHP